MLYDQYIRATHGGSRTIKLYKKHSSTKNSTKTLSPYHKSLQTQQKTLSPYIGALRAPYSRTPAGILRQTHRQTYTQRLYCCSRATHGGSRRTIKLLYKNHNKNSTKVSIAYFFCWESNATSLQDNLIS